MTSSGVFKTSLKLSANEVLIFNLVLTCLLKMPQLGNHNNLPNEIVKKTMQPVMVT